MSRPTKIPTAIPPGLLTLIEAAEIARVHPRTIRRWVADGYLTGYRFGPRLIRIALPSWHRTSPPHGPHRVLGIRHERRRGPPP